MQFIEYAIPDDGPYIVLESAFKSSKNSKIIHVLHLSFKNPVILGRGHESDTRITDISVSRLHAQLKFVDNEYYIEDMNSKFGTLLAMRAPERIQPSCDLSLQVGRSLLIIENKQARPGLCCLGGTRQSSAADRRKVSIAPNEEVEYEALEGKLTNFPREIRQMFVVKRKKKVSSLSIIDNEKNNQLVLTDGGSPLKPKYSQLKGE